MNIELKPIAESKIRQLGGTVCGVLVRNEAGALAAVSEHGRVTWLDDAAMGPVEKAARDQGAELVFWWDGDLADLDDCVRKDQTAWHTIPLYTHRQPTQPESGMDVEAIVAALRTCSSIAEAEAVVRAQMNLSVTPKPQIAGVPEGLMEALRDACQGWEKGEDIYGPMQRARALLEELEGGNG